MMYTQILFVTDQFTSQTVALGLAGIAASIGLAMYALRHYYQAQSAQLLEHKQDDNRSSLQRKYEEVNTHRPTKSYFWAGFTAALAATFLVINWTQYSQQAMLEPTEPMLLGGEQYVDIPITKPQTPPVAPPPMKKPDVIIVTEKPVIEPKPMIDLTIKGTPDGTGTTPTEGTIGKPEPFRPTTPIVEPPREEIEEVVFVAVEQMPRFPSSCESDANMSNDNKKMCADKAMLEYIYTNIKYPSMAREMGIEGTVVVTFVVGKDGSIEDIQILKDPGAGLGQEAKRIVEKMNKMPQKWTPGKQRGNTVKVKYNLPVRFKLAQ